MVELINKDIRMFYKERKDTKAINQMINCYQVLVNSIDALNITGGKNQYQNEVQNQEQTQTQSQKRERIQAQENEGECQNECDTENAFANQAQEEHNYSKQ